MGIIFLRNSKGSPIWNVVVKTFKMLEDWFNFKFGIGTTSVWYEPWLRKDSLCYLVSFIHIQDIDLQIKDIITIGGGNMQNIIS